MRLEGHLGLLLRRQQRLCHGVLLHLGRVGRVQPLPGAHHVPHEGVGRVRLDGQLVRVGEGDAVAGVEDGGAEVDEAAGARLHHVAQTVLGVVERNVGQLLA